MALVDFITNGISRVLHRLLPGQCYAPHGAVSRGSLPGSRTIACRTRYGAFEITVKEIP